MAAELRTALFLQAACTPTWRNFLDLPTAYATHYASAPAYDAYDGIGLGRDMDYGRMHLMPNGTSSQLEHLLPLEHISIGTCSKEAHDGTWHTQRIGPFRSHGGYDFWQFSWNDVLDLQGILDQDGEVAITAHFSGAVDEQGNPIPLPPIHVHHAEVFPWDRPTSFYLENAAKTLLDGSSYDNSILFGQAGDSQYVSAEGGTRSFGVMYEQYPNLIDSPLSIFAEFNDVRPRGAPPMVWWYQIAVRTSQTSANHHPVSVHVLSNPGRFDVGTTQTGILLTNMLPSHVDSFFYYTGRMPFNGVLVPELVTFHAHMGAFQSAILFAATPADIGLGPTFRPRVPSESTITTAAGFANNSALKAYIMGRAPKSSRICEAIGQMEQVGIEWYDRQASFQCAPWTFTTDDVFTVVSFNGPTVGRLVGMTGMAPTSQGQTFDFPQHTKFLITYLCDDGRTHATNAVYTQTLDAVPPFVDRFAAFRMILDGGSPRGPPTLADHAKVGMLTLVVWLSPISPPSSAGLFAALVPFVFPGVLLCRWTQVRRAHHLRCCTLSCSLYFTALFLAVVLLLSLCVSRNIPNVPFGVTSSEQAALKSTDSFKTRQADAAAATFTLMVLSFTTIALTLVWILRNLITGHQTSVRVATKDDKDSGSCLPLVKLKSPLL